MTVQSSQRGPLALVAQSDIVTESSGRRGERIARGRRHALSSLRTKRIETMCLGLIARKKVPARDVSKDASKVPSHIDHF